MLSVLSRLAGGSDDDNLPDEDVHEEPNADIGDKRISAVPMGEIFGYDSDVAQGKFIVTREYYGETATYGNGVKHYGWRKGKTLFRGTPEEWRQAKANPERYFEDIPVVWNEITAHVDAFLDLHEDQLDTAEYPHSTLNLD